MIKFLYRLLTGEYFNLYVGGGSPAPAQQPTQQTVTQTNLPAWAQPYSEQLLGKAQALTDINTNPYQSYTGDRLAGFTPMQQQAFQNIGGMQVSPQTGQATGLAGLAGMGSLGAGANYMNMATNPAAIQAFMSPYQQNVTDWQKQQAISDYGRQLPGLGAGASQAGAFGGTRHALVESEAQRNLQNQLAGIQAQGSQNAFNAAQQAQQFGAGLNLQGYGQATNAAQALNQFGQQQYQQQMGINAAQQQAGAQQQAMNQQQLTNQYQDWLNRQNYPYQQLAFMSDILHGTPTGGITTQQQYQAPPSMFNQIAGLGLGAYGLSNLFGKKEGGEIKGYKEGGAVKHFVVGGITGGMSLEAQYQFAKTLSPEELKAIVQGKPSEISASVAAAALPLAIQSRTAAQGMEAQQELAANKGKSVVDRMMETQGNTPVPLEQGLASLNADGVGDVDKLAEGGVIGFADRGYVEGEPDPWLPQTEEQALRRRLRIGDVVSDVVGVSADVADLPRQILKKGLSYPARLFGLPVGLPEAPKTVLPAQLQSQYNAQDIAEGLNRSSPTSRNVLRRVPPTPKGGLELLNAPPDQRAQIQAGIDARRAASPAPAAQAPAGAAAVAPQAAEARPTFGLPAALKQMQDVTKEYTDKQAELIKSLDPTAEDKESVNRERKGIMALKVASQLLKPGQAGTMAGLSAAGSDIAELAGQYAKEDRANKKAQIGAKISLLGAQAQLAQGNAKAAVDLYQHGEKMAYEYARFESDKEFRRVDNELKGKGFDETVRHNMAQEAARKRELDIMAQYRTDMGQYYKQMGAAAGWRGAVSDPKLRAQAIKEANAQLDKNPHILRELQKKNPNLTREQAAEMLADQRFNYARGLGSAASSIQRAALPENAEIAE